MSSQQRKAGDPALPENVPRPVLVPSNRHRMGRLTILKREREALAQRVAMLGDALSRNRAELDNFRKRTRREREDLIRRANEELLGSLLDVVDNLDRALAVTTETERREDPFVKGVEMIGGQLWGVLADRGLERMEVVGEEFDPARHEALEIEVVTDKPPNIVLAEHRPGYLLAGKVLRAALVKVSKSEAKEDSKNVEKTEGEK